MEALLLKIGGYIVTFLSGVLLAFGKGWVDDYFDKKRDMRQKIDLLLIEVTDEVADAVANGYQHNPMQGVKKKMFRLAAQLERYKETNMAFLIRSFINKWTIYYQNVKQLGDGLSISFNNVDERKMRDEIDTIVNNLLNKK